jgi:uncharacterized protein (TIGR02246 family)
MYRSFSKALLLLPILLLPLRSPAQASPESAIRAVLEAQVDAWNRGDVKAFMTTYEDDPQTTFVGDTVEHGYNQILERYLRNYGSRAAMGRLTFTNLQIRVLDAKYSVATGNFHLDRDAEGGGNADGIFSLVLRRHPSGWKILLDHSHRIK